MRALHEAAAATVAAPVAKPVPMPREAEGDLPDFETGWMHYVEDGKPAGYVAFLRPWHENWYDLHYFDNWVEAISRALALTKTRPNCVYVGGPEE